MDDIPSGFLKVPNMEYYQQKPNIPYTFPTNGMIHSSKFQSLVKLIIDQSKVEIYDLMEGHALQNQLSNISIIELGDFCRHILIINRDSIGWQTVDNYMAILDKHLGIPSWERPDFAFADDFNQMFSSILKWNFDAELTNLFWSYTEKNTIPYLSNERIRDKLRSNYQFWSIKELFLLFEGLVEEIQSFKTMKKYTPLLKSLADLIFKEIRKPNQTLERKIALLTMFSRGYVQIDYQSAQRLQEIVDRAWTEVENTFSTQDVDSYRYLFAVMYGHIGSTYYQYNIGFIDKRRLLNRIRISFFRFDEIDIGEWLDHFINSDVNQLVIEYVHNGYFTITNLLNQFVNELPPSSLKQEIQNQIIEVSQSLYNLAENYLSKLVGNNSLEKHIIYLIEREQNKSGETSRIITGMIKSIVNCFRYLVYHNARENWSRNQVEVIGQLNELIASTSSATLYTKHLLMLTGNYKYANILTKINYESQSTNSIINSTTFEDEIMSLTSSMMDEIKQTNTQSGKLMVDKLHELFYFISQWLLEFYNENNLFHDMLMISTPLLSIILIQLIQAYYEQQKYTLSLIIYLIMQHFTLVVRNKMDLVGSINRETTGEYMAKDFREMIQQWEIPEFMNINTIADKIKTLQFNTVDPRSEGEGMIEDELMIGFLELTTNLEEAINISNSKIQFSEMENKLYEHPTKGTHLFERIGLDMPEMINFPLIRNPHQYTAAASVIPFELNLENTLRELDIDNLIEYFFNMEDDVYEN